ncbi:MAG: glycosyltransferase family protein [Sumerlaeia bacterium]
MATSERLRFLICIVGVGAGNTTRNLAILERLAAMGDCEIRLAAQGRARELLQDRYKTYALKTVSYTGADGTSPKTEREARFNALQIVRSNLNFPRRFLDNERRIAEILQEYKPHLVVADSDFYCLRPARKLGFRLAAINNSPWTVEAIRRLGGPPADCGFSFHGIERVDAWLQRRYPHHVLSPVLQPLRRRILPEKIIQLPPFVRPGIRPMETPGEEIVVVTGGSGIDAAAIDLSHLEGEKVRIVGSKIGGAPADAVNVGFTLDVAEHLRRAKVLVIQGGFSSVSEALALHVPTVVIPVRNHAEQWCNGAFVERLGGGLLERHPERAGEAVRRILDRYDRFWKNAQAIKLPLDGHARAARILWRLAQGG